MIYRRGKNGIYSYRFRFAGRMIHESARTTSMTVARQAERQRRRELEERVNGIKKRGLPPTFALAAKEWMASRSYSVAHNTQCMARLALKHLLPVFGAKLLCDIVPRDIEDYQRARIQSDTQGRGQHGVMRLGALVSTADSMICATRASQSWPSHRRPT